MEESLYSNAEAVCRLETAPVEYVEVRQSAQVGECPALLSWSGWVTEWAAGWAG